MTFLEQTEIALFIKLECKNEQEQFKLKDTKKIGHKKFKNFFMSLIKSKTFQHYFPHNILLEYGISSFFQGDYFRKGENFREIF